MTATQKTTRKSSKSSPSPSPSSDAPTLSKWQAFEVVRLQRDQVKGADYNPRKIGKRERRRLEGILRSLKLLNPLVWNKRTGNLVSGHQRLSIIDELEGRDDYELDFAVVDLSPDEEIDANIALNNDMAMGQWDPDALGKLLDRGADLDSMLERTGFDMADLSIILPDAGFFAEAEKADDASALLTALEEQATTAEESTSERKGRDLPDKRRSKEGITETRNAAKSRAADAEDTENYAVLTFASRAKREEFMVTIGLEETERYADGADVLRLLQRGQ